MFTRRGSVCQLFTQKDGQIHAAEGLRQADGNSRNQNRYPRAGQIRIHSRIADQIEADIAEHGVKQIDAHCILGEEALYHRQ